MHSGVVVEKAIGVGIVPDQSIDLDHFAIDDSWPIFARHLSERIIGAAGERSIENIVGQLGRSDRKKSAHSKTPRMTDSIIRRPKKASIGLKSRTPPKGGRMRRNRFK